MPTLPALLALLHHPNASGIATLVISVILATLYVIRPRLRPLGHDTRLAYLALRHPEPIASWARIAMSFLDRGGLWMDEDPALARKVLARDWKITDEATLRGHLASLLHRSPMHAWDGMRALRISLTGACAGYIDEDEAWDIARTVAVGLQEHYASFEDALSDYLESRRAWRALPCDQEVEREAMTNLAAARRELRVSFRVDVASTTPSVLPPEAARYYR